MIKKVLISIVLFIVLVGCSNDDAYNNAIEKGLDYIASEEYKKAESAFELALEEKGNDKKATTLLEQIVNYQEALTAFQDADLVSAREKAEKVISLTDGSTALINKSEEIISSISEMEKALIDITNEYEKALKYFESKEYNDATKVIKKILKRDLDHQMFKQIEKDVKELQKKIDKALESERKAAEKTNRPESPASNKKSTENNAEEDTSNLRENKEIYNLNGYDVYDEDGMTFDAKTGEPVLHNHPIYDDYNVNTALEWAHQLYESGMSKEELKQLLYFNVEVSEEQISKAVDIFWAENF